MFDEEKWWRRIDNADNLRPYCLHAEDRCFYYRDYTVGGGYKCSETNQLIFNLKKTNEAVFENPALKKYKDEAICHFVNESCYFFDNLIKQGGEIPILLVPVPPSSVKSDKAYDDRLMQVVTLLSKRYPSLFIDEALSVTETLQPSHLNGPRRIDAFRSVLKFEKHCSVKPELIVIVDDVITSGAHYIACKSILSKHFPDTDIIGLFWAKSKHIVEYHLVDEG